MNKDIVTRLRLWQTVKGADSQITDELHLAADEIERLRKLVLLFDDYFVCEECEKACATYLRGCLNPLHALHTAAWEIR